MASASTKDAEAMEEREDLFGGQEKPYEDNNKRGCCTRKRWMVLWIVLVMLLLYGVGLAIGLAVGLNKDDDTSVKDASKAPSSVPLGVVVSDHEACSEVGRDILARHGTATDAAIATLICLGVRVPHSMGIGGGCFMLVYDKNERKTEYIDGRETSPHLMTADKYDQLGQMGCFLVVYDKSKRQAAAINGFTTAPYRMTRERYDILTSQHINARRIAVPGELPAYKMAHDTYGRMQWGELFKPTIKMIREGFPMAASTAKALTYVAARLKKMKMSITYFPLLCELFCSNTETGEVKVTGDMIYWPKMADTLEGIARDGPDYIYKSHVTTEMVREIQDLKGVLDKEDFTVRYKALRGDALSVSLGNYTLYTMGGATGGPVMAEILNILKGYGFIDIDMGNLTQKADTYHKMIEAMKFAWADRLHLEDPDYGNVSTLLKKMTSEAYADSLRDRITDMTHNSSYYTDITGEYKDAESTSHMSVVSPYGDAVSVTSTINWYFGSFEVSNSTGIIWNNEMDDFSKKEAGTNHVEPGKRPRSSMVPVIVVDREGKVKLVTGAAGGARITTTVAQVVAKILLLNEPLTKAAEDKRFHPELFNENQLALEKNFPQDLKSELEKRGHRTRYHTGMYMGVCNSIFLNSRGELQGHADSLRKPPGKTSYMYEYHQG